MKHKHWRGISSVYHLWRDVLELQLYCRYTKRMTTAIMSPHKVDRAGVKQFTDLPNVGKATAGDLLVLGFQSPSQLAGECPFEMHERLCQLTGVRHDPCVIDVFMSIVDFMNGKPPQPWWAFTAIRKEAVARPLFQGKNA